MQLFESKEAQAQRKGYEEFDFVDSNDSKSEAGGSQALDTQVDQTASDPRIIRKLVSGDDING